VLSSNWKKDSFVPCARTSVKLKYLGPNLGLTPLLSTTDEGGINSAFLLFFLFSAVGCCGPGTGPFHLCRSKVRGAELLNRQEKHFRGTTRPVVTAVEEGVGLMTLEPFPALSYVIFRLGLAGLS